jgi:predicted nucleotidyltransferase
MFTIGSQRIPSEEVSGASAMNSELAALAEVIATWLDGAPGVPVVYLFGSRVRGDHGPNSDWRLDAETMRWWMHQNDTDFTELKAQLPGPLAIHRETWDAADAAIKAGSAAPVLTVRKVVCVWTPATNASGNNILNLRTSGYEPDER